MTIKAGSPEAHARSLKAAETRRRNKAQGTTRHNSKHSGKPKAKKEIAMTKEQKSFMEQLVPYRTRSIKTATQLYLVTIHENGVIEIWPKGNIYRVQKYHSKQRFLEDWGHSINIAKQYDRPQENYGSMVSRARARIEKEK